MNVSFRRTSIPYLDNCLVSSFRPEQSDQTKNKNVNRLNHRVIRQAHDKTHYGTI